MVLTGLGPRRSIPVRLLRWVLFLAGGRRQHGPAGHGGRLLPLLAGAPGRQGARQLPAAHRHRAGLGRRPDRRRVLRRAAQGGPLRADPEAAHPGLPGLGGPELLRPRRHRPAGHRPGGRQHLRPPQAHPGRLDHHPADRQVAPHQRRGVRAGDQAQPGAEDPRADPGPEAGAGLHQGADPLALPERRLPGPPLLRRPGRGRELLPEERGGADPGRGGAHRRAAPGPQPLLPLPEPGRRQGAAPVRAPAHGRGGDDLARGARGGRRGGGQGLPGGRHLPRDRALLRRDRPAPGGGAVRQRAAAPGRAPGRDGHGPGEAAGRPGGGAAGAPGGRPPPGVLRRRWPAWPATRRPRCGSGSPVPGPGASSPSAPTAWGR